jgi:hypothetical protein
LGPTETSDDVCFRAAINGVADIKGALIRGVLIGGPPKLKAQRRNNERGCCPAGKSPWLPFTPAWRSPATSGAILRARESKFAERNQAGRMLQDLRRKIYYLSFSENRYFIAAIPPR